MITIEKMTKLKSQFGNDLETNASLLTEGPHGSRCEGFLGLTHRWKS